MLLQYNAHAPTPNTLPPSLTHSLAVSLSTSFSSCYLSLSLSLAPPPSFIRPLRTLFTHCLIFNMYSCAYIFNSDVSLIWIIYSPKHDLKFDFKHTCYIINLKFTTSFIAISICLQPRTNILCVSSNIDSTDERFIKCSSSWSPQVVHLIKKKSTCWISVWDIWKYFIQQWNSQKVGAL